MMFTCLCLCVDSLRRAGDSFVVDQRCAEHGLILQLLGGGLNTGLKNKRNNNNKTSKRLDISSFKCVLGTTF